MRHQTNAVIQMVRRVDHGATQIMMADGTTVVSLSVVSISITKHCLYYVWGGPMFRLNLVSSTTIDTATSYRIL